MYWVTKTDEVHRLVRSARGIEVNIKSELLKESEEVREAKQAKKNLYTQPIYENVPVKDLDNYKDCIIIYSGVDSEGFCKTHLNQELTDIISHFNHVPDPKKMKYQKSKCTRLVYKSIILEVDPNDQRAVTWKDVRTLCEQNKVDFKNQTLPSLVKEMRDRFYNSKSIRHVFTPEERAEIHQECPCCVECKKKLTIKQVNIDHIVPLACGGDNSKENLQVMCKKCHFAKTKEEHEHGYIKTSPTQSSFNQQTYDIFTSNLSITNAFVETIQKEAPKSLKFSKIFHLDINKCRKNRLYYSKHDFPLFTVMDQAELFLGEFRPGRYDVETDCHFPIRGNGWYYQPTVEYLLEQNLITVNDIKQVVYSGLTVPKDYFNEFIDYLYDSMGDFAKLSVNSMIGCFKPKVREHWKTLAITTDKNEAFHHFLQAHGCFVHSNEINEKWYYQVFEQSMTSREETESPLYEMILEMEAVELHKLATIVKDNKGVVLDLSTDCVTAAFPRDELPFELEKEGINIKGFYYDDKLKQPKYKLEDKEGRLKAERLPDLTRKNQIRAQRTHLDC